MSSKNNMEKVINYEFNKSEIENKIQVLNNKRYKGENDYNLLRKYKSEIAEFPIIKYLNDRADIISIEYIKDSTKENRQGKLSRDDFKQNTLNCVGIDLLVEQADRWVRTDLKVLQYYHSSKDKIYNGYLNEKYGVDNFVFQIEGRYNQLGWGWNRYKQTDELVILIPYVSKIYTFDYRKLIKFIGDKMKLLTINDCIIYDKDYDKLKREYKTREVCISVPIQDIPSDVLIDIVEIEIPRPIRAIRQR